MTPANHGWLATIWHINGPNVYDVVDVTEFDGDPSTDVYPTDTIRLKPSRNFLTVNDIELNKTLRFGPLEHGGIWEPYFGVRWMEIRDFTNVESVQPGYVSGGYSPGQWSDGIVIGAVTQKVIRAHYDTRNELIGGQLGARVLSQRGRWNITGDAKAFALQNYQFTTEKCQTTYIVYDAGHTETDRQANSNETSKDFSEFAFGMEIRAEAAYELTRDFSVRGGVELLQFYKGVARGADVVPSALRRDNTDELTAVGLTFGIAWNR
jgi:hypothetical protein